MIRVLHGDCREVLKTLPDESVHCVVTSPPYFGLRDYGTAKWDGGDAACDHVERKARNDGDRQGVDGFRGNANAEGHADMGLLQFRDICAKCGARRVDRQIGLEPTPEEYVARLVEVFREVRRVLRDDGTLWLNLGDSYASSGRSDRKESPGVGAKQEMKAPGRKLIWEAGGGHNFSWFIPDGNGGKIKPKDLVGIPWRVAFALQADGWYLRQDIIWHKPNPMPESVRDRCTKAHEYLFLLSKAERYYFDARAIAQPITESSKGRLAQPNLPNQAGSDRVPGKTNGNMKAVGPRFGGNKYGDDGREESRTKSGNEYTGGDGLANRRSVWTVTTQPFSEAHFATFPPALIEPCIMAGCPKGGTVLDPFAGAGTTGLVADRLGRNAVLIELNLDYCEMAQDRIRNDAPLFAEVWKRGSKQ